MRLPLFLAVLLFLGGAARAHAETAGPSFDCAKANSRAEILICASDDLKYLDQALSALYRDAKDAWPDRADALKQTQRDWLKRRDRSCPDEPTPPPPGHLLPVNCMLGLYHKRVEALVAQNLDPIMDGAAKDPEDSLARLNLLHSPLAKVYADILTHAVSNESIQNFDGFADTLAQSHMDPAVDLGPIRPIRLPCELVELYPRLLLLSRPVFGSSADSLLPTIACGYDYKTYPAEVADFLANDPMTSQNWLKRCWSEGTIMHGYARDEWLHELRISRFPHSYLMDTLSWTSTPETPWPDQQTLVTSNWAEDPMFIRARDALAGYYRRKFNLSASEAVTAATRALWDNRNTMEDPERCG